MAKQKDYARRVYTLLYKAYVAYCLHCKRVLSDLEVSQLTGFNVSKVYAHLTGKSTPSAIELLQYFAVFRCGISVINPDDFGFDDSTDTGFLNYAPQALRDLKQAEQTLFQ